MGWLASIFLKVFTGSTLSFVSRVVTSLSNEHVAIVQAQTGLAASEVTAVVQAEIERQKALSSVMQAEMTHRIWWWGWALFVLPAGAYTAVIHLKSILGGVFPAILAWNIPEVPQQIEVWDTYIVLSFFGLAATSSIVGSIVGRLGKAG